MTSIVKVHVVSGATGESPPCYILHLDNIRLMLDCGWNEHFDQEFIKQVSKHVKYVDAVLLSYPDATHLGALPYLVGKCGLSCPVFATIPVYKMGQMFMYDLFQSRYNTENFQIFSLDDVDAAFDKIIQLKYNQNFPLKGKGLGVSITPILAGHMLGGTIWKIMKAGEEDIVYAVDYNHKKERHLNCCNFERIRRPCLLITNSFNITYRKQSRRVQDERLLTNILHTLSKNGNVLIATDTAGRVLELAHMLDQLWGNKNSRLQSHSLCFLNNVSYNVIEFAKSQLDWMSDKLLRIFESEHNNPFQFKYIKTCHNLTDIYKISGCKVVLASMPDLECGFARDLCIEWLPNAANSIILTIKTSVGTLARNLLELSPNQKTLNVTIKYREYLVGEELNNFFKLNCEDEFSDEEDNSDSENSNLVNLKNKFDFVLNSDNESHIRKNKYSISRSYPLYPVEDVKRKYDEYGEMINITDYLKEREERCEQKVKQIRGGDIVENPTKCVVHEKQVEIRADIQLIEFEAICEGWSLQRLIRDMCPKAVILVRSPAKEIEACVRNFSDRPDIKFFTPSNGEVIDVTTESHIYQIRLTDALVTSLNLQKIDGMELAWLDAISATHSDDHPNMELVEKVDTKFDQIAKPIIINNEYSGGSLENQQLVVFKPFQDVSQIEPHSPIFLNELKFGSIKSLLSKNGIHYNVRNGSLICDKGTISIRNIGTRIILQGCLSKNYYKIRKLLYSQFIIL